MVSTSDVLYSHMIFGTLIQSVPAKFSLQDSQLLDSVTELWTPQLLRQ